MGFDGTPSRACLACKRKRQKCDETYPACRNCSKTGIKCPGVKLKTDVVFRDQTRHTEKHFNRRAASQSSPESAVTDLTNAATKTSPSSSDESSPPDYSVSNDLVLQGSSASRLKEASTNAILGAFATNFMTKRDIDSRGMHLDHLANMFGDVHLDSPLRPTTEAVAMNMFRHVFAVKDPIFVRNSFEANTGALIALGKGLKDPKFATSDEALMCTVIMSLMEFTCSSDPEFRATRMHINGAIDIVLHRGAYERPSKAYLKLFRMVRTQMVMKHIHEASPVPTFPSSAGWTFDRHMTRGFASDLQVIAFAVLDLRIQCKTLFDAALPETPDEDALDELVYRADAVIEQLNDWFASLPETWGFETLAIDPEAMDYRGHSIGWNGLMHSYPGIYVAVNINLYRSLIIYAQSVLVRCGSILGDSELAESAILRTVDEICYSVSWFGFQPSLRAGSADKTMAGGRHGYYLLIALYVCLTVEIIPDDQRAWLRQVMFSRSVDPPLAIAAFLYNPAQDLIWDGLEKITPPDGGDPYVKKTTRTQPVPYLPVGLTMEEVEIPPG